MNPDDYDYQYRRDLKAIAVMLSILVLMFFYARCWPQVTP